MRDGFRKQIADHTAVRTNVTLRVLLAEWLAGHQVEPSTRASYALLIDRFILPALGDQTLPTLAKLGPRPYEKLYAELRTCRRRCRGKPFTEHRTPAPHECDERCAPHTCRPLAASSIRQIHAVLSSAYSAAVRWGWVAFNPMEPRRSPDHRARPRPADVRGSRPHRGRRVGRGPDWGMLVWTLPGYRRTPGRGTRAALGARRSRHRRADDPAQRQRASAARPTIKDTKTHQSRRICRRGDRRPAGRAPRAGHCPCTEHRRRLRRPAFVFSYHRTTLGPCSPSGVTHRYARMVAQARHPNPVARNAPLQRDRTARRAGRPSHRRGRLGHERRSNSRCGCTPHGWPRPISRRRSYWPPDCRARDPRPATHPPVLSPFRAEEGRAAALGASASSAPWKAPAGAHEGLLGDPSSPPQPAPREPLGALIRGSETGSYGAGVTGCRPPVTPVTSFIRPGQRRPSPSQRDVTPVRRL